MRNLNVCPPHLYGDDDHGTGRRADVADGVFLGRVWRVYLGHGVQPVRPMVLGVGVGVGLAEHRHHAVERMRAGRLVRRPPVHHVPAPVHPVGGVHVPAVPGDRRVQGARTPGRFRRPGGGVRTELAHILGAPAPVPGVRVIRGRGVPGPRLAHQPHATVPVVPVRGVRRLDAAAVLLQHVPPELEHVLLGDALCAPVLRRLLKVPGHQRRVVGCPVRHHGQQQVSGGSPVVVAGVSCRGHVRIARPTWPADGDGRRGAQAQARADARVGRTTQQHVRWSTGPVAHHPVHHDTVRHLQRGISRGRLEF